MGSHGMLLKMLVHWSLWGGLKGSLKAPPRITYLPRSFVELKGEDSGRRWRNTSLLFSDRVSGWRLQSWRCNEASVGES